MYTIVDKVIYFYIFICLFLLIYNIVYIIRRTHQKKRRARQIERWKAILTRRRMPVKKLRNPEALTAWHSALFAPDSPLSGGERAAYLDENRQALLHLAWDYRRHDAMERAFCAYILREIFLADAGDWRAFAGPLLSYLDHSTVYCRENVLQALYVLGHPDAIGKAFGIMNGNGWYHDPRLLSDGLMEYSGDKEQLIRYLWANREKWMDEYGVAIVRFAMQVSPEFQKDFLCALRDRETPLEIRFALVRYFRKYPGPAAGEYLRSLFEEKDPDDSSLTIAAASSLVSYPDRQTRAVLKHALSSRNWYVRHNAALSLHELGITPEEIDEIRLGEDRYALEMIQYITEREEA